MTPARRRPSVWAGLKPRDDRPIRTPPPRPTARRGLTVAVVVAVLVAAAAGCSGAKDQTDRPATVTIGLLAPASGPGADIGLDAARGAQLAIDVVNKPYPDLPVPLAAATGMPGLGGASLTLVTGDTTGSRDTAETQANELVGPGHAVALVTTDSAEVAEVLGAQTQRLGVPLVDAASSADYLAELGLEWYFRIGPTDRTIFETGFSLLRSQLPSDRPARLAVLQDKGGAMAAGVALVKELAGRAKYPIAVTLEIDPKAPNPAELASVIDSGQVDVVVAILANPDAPAVADDVLSRLARPLPMLGLGAGFGHLPAAPPAPAAPPSTVVLRADAWSADFAARSPVGVAVSALYQRRFGARMTDAAANAFTATLAVAAAIDAAGSTDPSRIRAALRQLWLPATQIIMPWNGLRFDATGQNELAAAVIEARMSGGYEVVFPRELASRPVLWPPSRTAR